MTSFAPINDDHAVTQVIFSLRFDEVIEPLTLEAARRTAPWLKALPAISELPPVEVTQGGHSFEVPALQFAIVRPDAKPIWALRLNGYELEVECTAYSRWAEVWRVAQEYIEQAWAIFREHQEDINIVDFRLSVTDAFVSEAESYDISELFKDGKYYKRLEVANDGVWHRSLGWMEDEEAAVVSHALWLKGTARLSKGKYLPPYRVTAKHMLRSVVAIDGVPQSSSDLSDLDRLISLLHEKNKEVVAGLLTDEMNKRVGLV